MICASGWMAFCTTDAITYVADPQSPIFYILMREVTIPEHPDVMPDEDEVRSVAEEAVHDALDFLSRKKKS